MYQNVGFGGFCDAFQSMGRNDQFSYAAKRAIFDYLEEYEDSTGTPVELDVIAICCDYSEYDSAREAAEEHGWDCGRNPEDYEDDAEGYQEAVEEEALDWLQDRTTVLELDDGGVVIQAF
jgi:hypothetical protein